MIVGKYGKKSASNKRKITTMIDEKLLENAIEIYVKKYGIKTKGLISAVIEEALRTFIEKHKSEELVEEEINIVEI